MVYESFTPTLGTAFMNTVIAALHARPAGALMSPINAHLFTAAPFPLVASQLVLSNFTEATFPGYSGLASGTGSLQVSLPSNAGFGRQLGYTWSANSSIVSPGQVVNGYWLDNGITTIYLAEWFPSPVLFVAPFDFLALSVVLGFPFATITGEG